MEKVLVYPLHLTPYTLHLTPKKEEVKQGQEEVQEVEKEADFENAGRENIEEKLQAFVGMDILKSVSFTKEQDSWKLELEKPVFCTNDPSICTKYPCPTCSAVLTAITKASKKEIWINDTTHNGKKMAFHLKMRE